ncbi:hypothetical protein D918_00468 [Trichuris suis]|nr:hypothetical protein D918_00468 [Trichuris suis]
MRSIHLFAASKLSYKSAAVVTPLSLLMLCSAVRASICSILVHTCFIFNDGFRHLTSVLCFNKLLQATSFDIAWRKCCNYVTETFIFYFYLSIKLSGEL